MSEQFLTAFDILKNEENEGSLSVGCDNIDNVLNGGLCKGITELSGESGVGKSLFALQLSFHVQLPKDYGGLNGNAMYFCTDKKPSKDVFDMLNKYYNDSYGGLNINFGDNIQLLTVKCAEHQEWLMNGLKDNIEKYGINLVVIDSIASLFRFDNEYIKRSKKMANICHFLKELAYKYNIIVLMVNDVSDVFKNEDILFSHTHNGSIESSGRRVKPTLGLSWGNHINTRLMLSKHKYFENIDSNSNDNKNDSNTITIIERKLYVIFSSYIKGGNSVYFEINNNGIKGISDELLIKRNEHLRRQSILLGTQYQNNINNNNNNNNNDNNNDNNTQNMNDYNMEYKINDESFGDINMTSNNINNNNTTNIDNTTNIQYADGMTLDDLNEIFND